jgi:replicative DNA helicase
MSYEAQLEVERELLAALCQNPNFLDMWLGRLRPELFTTPLGSTAFPGILGVHEDGETLTFATMTLKLGEGGIAAAGGPVELSCLFSKGSTPALIRKFVTILEENLAKRNALSGANMIKALVESGADYKQIQPAVEQLITAMDIPQSEAAEFVPLGSVMAKVIDEIEAARKNEGRLQHPSTGITDLDDKIGGLAPGTFIVVHAKTSRGKSAFATQLLAEFAKQEAKGLVFSYEMSSSRLSKRLLAHLSKVSLKHLIRGTLSQDEMFKLEGGIRTATGLPIYFRENCVDMNINAIRREARRAKKQFGIGLVIVDYIQLVPPANFKDNRERQVAATSYGLQKMAQELDICVVGLAQVNDDGLLRESRAQAMDADIVLGLEGDDEGERTLRIHKNRDGELGAIDLEWNGAFQTFSQMI